MLEDSLPPGYQRQKPVRRPMLGPWQGVIDAILEDDKQRPRKQRHTAKRIFDRLRASGRRVGIASVYRVLELLTSEGFVQRIDLGSGISRYEPIHSGGDHHHHLVCDSCGKVEAFEDRELERAIHRLEKTSGYAVAAHDVVLHGSCSDCR